MSGRPVYLVDGARTPFLRARGRRGPFTPVDLAVQSGRVLLLRQPLPRDAFDTVVLGCVNVIADEVNPARVAALRLGLGAEIPAYTVQINCGSGMQSIELAFRAIEEGRSDVVLAGGAESLSHAPLVIREAAVDWLARLGARGGLLKKLRLLTQARADFFKPVIGLERGLTDPIVELSMGQTAEVLAHLFGITREAADRYALESHQRLARAQAQGWLDREVVPMVAADGTLYERDDGVRPDTTLERLAALEPVFEPPHGKVTAGNSSQITDGASWVILASEAACERHGLEPLARLLDSEWRALDPALMGLGPALCAAGLLERRQLALDAIDVWELNEAFAAQVLACVGALDDADFCRDALGRDGAVGRIPRERLNVDGGAISLGHPVGTSGNRIVLHLANALRRLGGRRGIATQCIGGGQGGAVLMEAV